MRQAVQGGIHGVTQIYRLDKGHFHQIMAAIHMSLAAQHRFPLTGQADVHLLAPALVIPKKGK